MMDDKFNLEINDFGIINEANIEINKINVVGGVNSSGKSTASKILYCLLKANSVDIKDFILASSLPKINKFINIMTHPDRLGVNHDPDKFTVDDDINEIKKEYTNALKLFNNYKEGSYFVCPEEVFDDCNKDNMTYLKILLDKKENPYPSIVKALFKYESLINSKGKISFFTDLFKCLISYDETGKDNFLIERAYQLRSKNVSFDDLDYNFIYKSNGEFNTINKVFYIDSISTFDLDYYMTFKKSSGYLYNHKEHVEYLLKELRYKDDKSNLSEEIIEKIDFINLKINDIIKGGISRTSYLIIEDEFIDDPEYFYYPNNSEELYNVNISSGIQQISIIEILLSNYKLLPGSFLIIDEPEVNLHPEWQIKFAHILVLLAKELDINLYLNSHSPMFIEAISLYSKYYDLIDETNFYLTYKSENDKFNFRKISPDDMGAVYENLTSPFDELDKIKAKILFKE